MYGNIKLRRLVYEQRRINQGLPTIIGGRSIKIPYDAPVLLDSARQMMEDFWYYDIDLSFGVWSMFTVEILKKCGFKVEPLGVNSETKHFKYRAYLRDDKEIWTTARKARG